MSTMTKNEQAREIAADIISRPNAMDGIYRKLNLNLEVNDLLAIKNDLKLVESCRMRADYADKILEAAKKEGADLTNESVLAELSEEIHAAGEPLPSYVMRVRAAMNTLKVAFFYGITIGLWGLVFKQSFLTIALYGFVISLIILTLLLFPVIAMQRTKQGLYDVAGGASSIHTGICIIASLIASILIAFGL